MRQTKFENRYPYAFPSTKALLQWFFERKIKHLPPKPKRDLSPVKPNLSLLNKEKDSLLLYWIGHSTVLLRMSGIFILTDPHFSENAFPVPGIGPKRWQEPGIKLEELPKIDLILISHNHYDHLDRFSVRTLARRFPEALFLVPQGLEKWFARFAPRARVKAMVWDERVSFQGIQVIFTAVQHWSRRGFFDTDSSLWGGFVVRSPRESFFFAGDLGYSKDIADIGNTYSPFDLCALPIGAYSPRYIMKPHHLDPEEALLTHRDLKAKHSVAIHWGTFHGLTDEALDQPVVDLAHAREKFGISEEEFFVIPHGGHVMLKKGEIRKSACPAADGKNIQEEPQGNREEPPAMAG